MQPYVFQKPNLNAALQADITRFNNQWVECISRNGNPRNIRRLHLTNHGIDAFSDKLDIYLQYGEKYQEKSDEFMAFIREHLCKGLGLTGIAGQDRQFFLCTGESIIGFITGRETYSNRFTVSILAPKDLLDILLLELRARFGSEIPPSVGRAFVSGPDLRTMRETLPVRAEPKEIRAFYPYIDQSPADIWREFVASNSNVMLLIGPPGTGKSNFILSMMNARGWDDNVYLADHDGVLQHAELADYIRSKPRGSVMITEDSDRIVAKREEGNSIMSALLNTTAGIVSTDTKLIISTNLATVKKVDEALLRKGRMFRVLEFKTLTPAEANLARAQMDLPAVDFLSDVTLAEALNYEQNSASRKAARIGFVP